MNEWYLWICNKYCNLPEGRELFSPREKQFKRRWGCHWQAQWTVSAARTLQLLRGLIQRRIIETHNCRMDQTNLDRNWDHGRRKGGGLAPLDFEIVHFSIAFLAKKGRFLSFEKEKWNFTIFGPPWKYLHDYPQKKSPLPPPWKNPSDAHDWDMTITGSKSIRFLLGQIFKGLQQTNTSDHVSMVIYFPSIKQCSGLWASLHNKLSKRQGCCFVVCTVHRSSGYELLPFFKKLQASHARFTLNQMIYAAFLRQSILFHRN